jgi:hypothetical protein
MFAYVAVSNMDPCQGFTGPTPFYNEFRDFVRSIKSAWNPLGIRTLQFPYYRYSLKKNLSIGPLTGVNSLRDSGGGTVL